MIFLLVIDMQAGLFGETRRHDAEGVVGGINARGRICVRWREGHVHDVEIVDYH